MNVYCNSNNNNANNKNTIEKFYKYQLEIQKIMGNHYQEEARKQQQQPSTQRGDRSEQGTQEGIVGFAVDTDRMSVVQSVVWCVLLRLLFSRY